MTPTASNLFFTQSALSPEGPAVREKKRAASREWRIANPERVKALQAAWRKKHPEKAAEASAAWRKNHPEKVRAAKAARREKFPTETKASLAAWRKENPDKTRESLKNWKARNPDKVRKHYRERERRRLRDPEYRLKQNLRGRVRRALKGLSKAARTKELLGCSVGECRAHLEKQFRPGMTWENYGAVWHVDHIRPCASFDLPAQQFECFHYSNLQPLFAAENLRKGKNFSN